MATTKADRHAEALPVHRCAGPICTPCEIAQASSLEEMLSKHDALRKAFAAHGHDYDDPSDDWHLL